MGNSQYIKFTSEETPFYFLDLWEVVYTIVILVAF